MNFNQVQDIEDLLKDRIPELSEPDWMKYLKSYIVAKLESTEYWEDYGQNDWENDPATVILEDSEFEDSADSPLAISGDGSPKSFSEQGSGTDILTKQFCNLVQTTEPRILKRSHS